MMTNCTNTQEAVAEEAPTYLSFREDIQALRTSRKEGQEKFCSFPKWRQQQRRTDGQRVQNSLKRKTNKQKSIIFSQQKTANLKNQHSVYLFY